MDVDSSSGFHVVRGLGGIRLILVLLLIVVFPAGLRAEHVLVGRDGTLIFQTPSSGSTVLDILPRGTQLELVKRGEKWSEVQLPESNTSGFIQTSALGASTQTTGPAGAGMLPQYTSSLSAALEEELDRSTTKIRKIENSLDQLKKIVEMYGQSEGGMIGPSGERIGTGTGTEAFGAGSLSAYSYGFHVFSGLYFKERDFTVGGAVSWFPRLLAGFGLELEGGNILMEGDRKGTSLDLSLLCPLPLKGIGLLPFISGGGGVVRLSGDDDAGFDSDTRVATHLGFGALYRLSGGFSLRGELRVQNCEDEFDGRVSLALHHGF